MSCLWDRSWEPTDSLPGPCDWVSCLQPPRPPESTHLRVTDWDGHPVQFGDLVRLVCQRGFYFEEDPAQVDVSYSCQDGTAKDTDRGFFDIPEEEEDWPRCIQSIHLSVMNYANLFLFQPPCAQNRQKYQRKEFKFLSHLCLIRKLSGLAQ